jgi:hypothetical protein
MVNIKNKVYLRKIYKILICIWVSIFVMSILFQISFNTWMYYIVNLPNNVTLD